MTVKLWRRRLTAVVLQRPSYMSITVPAPECQQNLANMLNYVGKTWLMYVRKYAATSQTAVQMCMSRYMPEHCILQQNKYLPPFPYLIIMSFTCLLLIDVEHYKNSVNAVKNREIRFVQVPHVKNLNINKFMDLTGYIPES